MCGRTIAHDRHDEIERLNDQLALQEAKLTEQIRCCEQEHAAAVARAEEAEDKLARLDKIMPHIERIEANPDYFVRCLKSAVKFAGPSDGLDTLRYLVNTLRNSKRGGTR